MKGRKHKPTRLKILHGTSKPTSEVRTVEAANIQAPTHLSSAAKRIWRASAKVVSDMGLLTIADVEAFGHYCELTATVRRLTKRVAQEGEIVNKTVLDSHGKRVQKSGTNPALVALRAAEKEWRQLGGLFGFSPSSRKQFGIEPEQPPDEFQQFLNDEKQNAS